MQRLAIAILLRVSACGPTRPERASEPPNILF